MDTLMHAAAWHWLVPSRCVSFWIVKCVSFNSNAFSFLPSLCCSCLGDCVRGSRPGQRQSETGGEFLSLNTPHVFTFRLFKLLLSLTYSQPNVIVTCLYILLGHERAIFEHDKVRQLRFSSVWIPLLNDLLDWRRSLSFFGTVLRSLLINARGEGRWCHQTVPGVSLQREQC